MSNGGNEMSITSCKRCGRLYNKTTSDICPDCVRQEEVTFNEIKLFLRTHENAGVDDVVEALGVDEELVIKFLREGRLIASKKMTYPCAECGKPIQTGKFCPECLEKIVNTVNDIKTSLLKSNKPQGGYFSDRD